MELGLSSASLFKGSLRNMDSSLDSTRLNSPTVNSLRLSSTSVSGLGLSDTSLLQSAVGCRRVHLRSSSYSHIPASLCCIHVPSELHRTSVGAGDAASERPLLFVVAAERWIAVAPAMVPVLGLGTVAAAIDSAALVLVLRLIVVFALRGAAVHEIDRRPSRRHALLRHPPPCRLK